MTWATPAVVGLFAVVVLLRAWQGDDAYITWRTAANFVRGDGLTWNEGERVQAFTSPLFLLVGILCQALFGEVYFSVLLVSILASTAALWLLLKAPELGAEMRVGVGLSAVGSATLVDFGTSGLETPALALLSVLFALAVAREQTDRASTVSWLLFLCRPDSLVMTAPALLVLIARADNKPAALRRTALLHTPIALWIAFSIFYFGSPVANTALAKLNSEVPRAEMLSLGTKYLVDFALHEPWPTALALLALGLGFRSKDAKVRGLAAGLLAHLLYVVWVGGDFMRGRFVFVALWLALGLVCLELPRYPRVFRRAFVVAGALSLITPGAPLLHLGASDTGTLDRNESIVSERAYYAPSTGLTSVLISSGVENDKPLPPYRGGIACQDAAKNGPPVMFVVEAGFCGYFGGPDLLVFDSPALTNPFLARVPFVPSEGWRVGHLKRGNMPVYVKRRSLDVAFFDKKIEAAYQDVDRVTRGPLFTMNRMAALGRLLSGRHAEAFDKFKAAAPPAKTPSP